MCFPETGYLFVNGKSDVSFVLGRDRAFGKRILCHVIAKQTLGNDVYDDVTNARRCLGAMTVELRRIIGTSFLRPTRRPEPSSKSASRRSPRKSQRKRL